MDYLSREAKGKRNPVQVLDAWADRRPEKIHVSVLKSANVSDGFHDWTHRQIRDAADTFAWWLCDTYGKSQKCETICYVGHNDLRYAVVFFGAIKAGYKTLFVSPRNPAAVNASLVQQTSCSVFFHSPEVSDIVPGISAHVPGLVTAEIKPFNDWLDSWTKPFPYTKTYEESEFDDVLILHSSGSTGTPKPITINNGFWRVFDEPKRPIAERFLGGRALLNFPSGGYYFSPFPFFHLAGVEALMISCVMTFEASAIVGLPDRPPTPQLVLDIINLKRPRALYCPPSIIEMVSQVPGGMAALKTCDTIIYGGGPLADSCGDQLKQDVHLGIIYGSTETGPKPLLLSEPNDWNCIEFHPDFHAHMEPAVDGTSELVLYRDDPYPELRGTTWSQPHVRVYRTRDTFKPHPMKANLWKFYGRNDDVIVFSNGAKYNPVPAESSLLSSDLITGVLIVGDGETQAAALIEPKDKPSSAEELIDDLWSDIESANDKSQKQGHLVRSKVAIVEPGGLIRAPKGTIVRSLTKEKFKSVIRALYDDDQETILPCTVAPRLAAQCSLSFALRDFVKQCTERIQGLHKLKDDDDFYLQGLDSVRTAEMVNMLRKGLSQQFGRLPWLTIQTIFEHPSIRKLATSLQEELSSQSSQGLPSASSSTDLQTIHRMEEMIAKYSIPSNGLLPDTRAKHVAITGSTGSLGLRILQELIQDPSVGRITCLDRSSDARARVGRWISGVQLTRVNFHQVKFNEPGLGLDCWILGELIDTVEVIVHCAWQVDFNLSLDSFESVHVAGVARLVELSAQSRCRPRIVFVSSISSASNWPQLKPSGAWVSEEVIFDASVAARMGYAQSKYVAERILANAAQAGVPVSILRAGQIAGTVRNDAGPIWNSAEWVPSLLATSKALRKLPQYITPADWIPVDTLATIIGEILRNANKDALESQPLVYNLVNLQKTPWSSLVQLVQDRFGGPSCEVVPLEEWIRCLREIDTQEEGVLTKYPALKILPFFEDMVQLQQEGIELHWRTDNAARASKTFAELDAVAPEWLVKWMEQWGM